MVNKELSNLQEIIFNNKEKLSDEDFTKAMTCLNKVNKESKSILVAIPVKRGIHICPIHKHFDLVVECIYLTITKDEYEFYDEIEIGSPFYCMMYGPLQLMYSAGIFKFQYELGGDPIEQRNIIGKVLFVKS